MLARPAYSYSQHHFLPGCTSSPALTCHQSTRLPAHLVPSSPAGLHLLSLEAASGCVVFEEANQAPLELEMSHTARLLEAASSRWRVTLSMCKDAVDGAQRQRLELICIAQDGK